MKAQLTQGPVGRTLFRLTLPMIAGILSTVAFNLIDTYFVGQLGANELAAISFTFPVIFTIMGITFGIGVGTAAVISRAIGKGDHYRIQRLTSDSLVLSLLIVFLFVIAGLLTIGPLFRLIGASDDLIGLIKIYMQIWYPGMLFLVIPIVGNNAIRASGDTRTPGILMVVAVIINTILDPLLIFGIGPFPRLELAGAAIASIIARAVTLLAALWILYYRDKMITLKNPRLDEVLKSWRQILYIGIPTAGTNIILPMGYGIITKLISGYGKTAVAAYGVASRIDMFSLTVLMALSSVLAPFIGQNLGAGKIDRIKRGLNLSQGFALLWGTFVYLILLFSGKYIAAIFNENQEVINTIVIYLSIVPVSYGLHGVLSLSNSSLNVLNKPLYAAMLNMIMMFVLFVPLAYIGSGLYGLRGIFLSGATSFIVAGIVSRIIVIRMLRKTARDG